MKAIHAFSMFILILTNSTIAATEDFYLGSPYNKGSWCLSIDNDVVWNEDSNFTNGWGIQYHSVRYASWDETRAPGYIKWVGNHFPTLNDDDTIVRYGQGIGQLMVTPADLGNPDPPEGDLPYAGTLTYSLSWQNYRREVARNFQITAGVLGKESLADEFQKFVHNDLGLGEDPKGWHTQRKTEPIINFAYQHIWRLAYFGEYTNGWAGQLALTPMVSLGNLVTGADLAVGFRTGWNIPEGFTSSSEPPGRKIFANNHLPKPSAASPHGVELVLHARVSGVLYSVLYDGSIITGDDRKVDTEDLYISGTIGINYYYYKLFSVRLTFVQCSDILIEESLPPSRPGQKKTGTDNSYGTLMIEFYF